jgi:hypothetical protein
MKAKLLRKVGAIKKGALVEISGKTGVNDRCRPGRPRHGKHDLGAGYAVTDKDGQSENVDTRDLTVVR